MKPLTKQGVRNLDLIPVKSVGRKLPMPPKEATVCRHDGGMYEHPMTGDTTCKLCGQSWYWDGIPYGAN